MSLVATGELEFGGDSQQPLPPATLRPDDVHLETNLRSPMADFPISYAGDGRQYLAGSTGSAATATVFTLA